MENHVLNPNRLRAIPKTPTKVSRTFGAPNGIKYSEQKKYSYWLDQNPNRKSVGANFPNRLIVAPTG